MIYKAQQSQLEMNQQKLQVYNMCTVGEIKMTSVHIPSKEGQQQPVQVYSIMILPQVHLRKPCYDFYFL
jgi:hypothetical protein